MAAGRPQFFLGGIFLGGSFLGVIFSRSFSDQNFMARRISIVSYLFINFFNKKLNQTMIIIKKNVCLKKISYRCKVIL